MILNASNESLEQASKNSLSNALSKLHLNSKENTEGDITVDKLLTFVAMLLKWNRTYNLTALKKVSAILEQHIIDSLTAIPNLDKYFQEKNITSPKILDVGSGAGLPGVVFAITKPNYNICCLDAVEKKTAFVSAVKGQLGLKNLSSVHARVELLDPVQADIVISRAFASISDFIALAHTHVCENGRLVAMKAKDIEEEITEMTQRFPNWKVEAVQHLSVPESNMSRCLVWLLKEE